MKETAREKPKDSSAIEGPPASSLIICSRNRPKILFETVESVLQGDEVPTELVIIDQSDAPHPSLATLTTDRACEIRYQWTHSLGAARARNTGIRKAQHDIIALIDDDMRVAPTWFGSLTRVLVEAGQRTVVTGRVLTAEADTPGGFAPSTKVDEVPAVYEGRVGKEVLYTGNMAMYRSVIDDIGPFDERLGPGTSFPAAEDNDLGFRLLEAGYRIIYSPAAVVYHRAWRTERDHLPLRWDYGRGQGAYYAKHLTLRDTYMLRRMSLYIMRRILRFPFRVWHRPRLAYDDVVHLFGLLSGASEWLRTRRRTR